MCGSCRNCPSYCSCPCHGSSSYFVPHPPPPPSPYKTFYMLYAEGGGAPTVPHHDYALAETEAVRLATSLKKRVYVLTAFKVVEVVAAPVKWTEMSKNK